MGSKLSTGTFGTLFSRSRLRTKFSVMVLIFGSCSKLQCHVAAATQGGPLSLTNDVRSNDTDKSFDTQWNERPNAANTDVTAVTRPAPPAKRTCTGHHRSHERFAFGSAPAPPTRASTARSRIDRLEHGTKKTKRRQFVPGNQTKKPTAARRRPAPGPKRRAPAGRRPTPGPNTSAPPRRRPAPKKSATRGQGRGKQEKKRGQRRGSVPAQRTASKKQGRAAGRCASHKQSGAGAAPEVPRAISAPAFSLPEDGYYRPSWKDAEHLFPLRLQFESVHEDPKITRAKDRAEVAQGLHRGSGRRFDSYVFPSDHAEFLSPEAGEPDSPLMSRQGSAHGDITFFSFEELAN